jgi:ferrous iron transport protein A
MARKRTWKKPPAIDKPRGPIDTIAMLQMSSNNDHTAGAAIRRSLADLGRGDAAILDCIDLTGEEARRLMELGFLPGARITAGRSAPGGDPRVFQVDGSEVALRRETARRLQVRLSSSKRS